MEGMPRWRRSREGRCEVRSRGPRYLARGAFSPDQPLLRDGLALSGRTRRFVHRGSPGSMGPQLWFLNFLTDKSASASADMGCWWVQWSRCFVGFAQSETYNGGRAAVERWDKFRRDYGFYLDPIVLPILNIYRKYYMGGGQPVLTVTLHRRDGGRGLIIDQYSACSNWYPEERNATAVLGRT